MGAVGKGLGKGLGALLSVEGIPEQAKDSVVELKINDVHPNADQPRKSFSEEGLQELADSIVENGIIQPIIVAKRGSAYRIVAGERRWRAARKAGLSVIPSIVRELSDLQTMEQALIENIQREDLNPLEEAYAMDHLMRSHGLTQEKLSQKLGKSRPAIANTLRLLSIDPSLMDYIRSGELSAGHARALLPLISGEEQIKAAELVLARGMSVRATEEYVRKLQAEKDVSAPKERVISQEAQAIEISVKEVEQKLRKHFGTKVSLKTKDRNSGRGALVIEYFSYDDLERLMEIIKPDL